MTVFVITMLFIWAMIATAMAVTYWRAWREVLAHLDYQEEDDTWMGVGSLDMHDIESDNARRLYELTPTTTPFSHLTGLDSPAIDTQVSEEYGEDRGTGEGGTTVPPELDALLFRLRRHYGGTDAD